MRDSESPERTRYSSPLEGADGVAGAVVAGVLTRTGGAGGAGREARGAAGAPGVAATGGDAASAAGDGAGVITADVAGGAACAWREPGGSSVF